MEKSKYPACKDCMYFRCNGSCVRKNKYDLVYGWTPEARYCRKDRSLFGKCKKKGKYFKRGKE